MKCSRNDTVLFVRFILIFLLQAFQSRAQYEDSGFVRYTVKDGLSGNYVIALQQDDLGYIWIGTTEGLNRFDGKNFKHIFRSESASLPSASISRLKNFGNERLGIITKRGLHIVNTRDLSYQRYFISDTTAFVNYINSGWEAQELPDNTFALTTASGFYVFEASGNLKFRHDVFTLKDFGQRILYGREIIPVNKNELLIYTHKSGLAHYDIEKKQYNDSAINDIKWDRFRIIPRNQADAHQIPIRIADNEYIILFINKDSIGYYNTARNQWITSLLPFQSGKQFSWESRIAQLNDSSFAVSSGIGGFYTFTLDRTTGHINLDPQKKLAGYVINTLFRDKEKRLWLGTTQGVLRQRIHENIMQTRYYSPAPNEPSVLGFTSAYRYKDKLYVARHSQQNGLVVIDTATNAIVKRVVFFGGENSWNEISSVTMYHPDTLWLATAKGILWMDIKTYRYDILFDPKKYPLAPSASANFSPVNKDGYAWICYWLEGCVVRYQVNTRQFTFFTENTKPALPFKKAKNITYDSYGDVWIGGHSLARWNSKLQDFDTLISVYGGINKFNDDILMLTADDKGSLWLHNAENALLEYRIREKKFVPYSTSDGLPTVSFQAFSPVVGDNLWIASATKLTRFNVRTAKSFIYDYADGFPEDIPSSRRISYDTASNSLYLFCRNYIVRFPARPVQRAPINEPLLIQEVSINDNKVFHHPDDIIRLKYFENTINVQFNVIDYESPNSYQLSYRVDNDATWTITNQGSVSLSKLQPGKHNLIFKASGKNGEERFKSLVIFIGKPFWKTTWFILSIAFLLAALAYYLYRRRLNSIHQKANLDKQLAQTQMKALHAQMNPHFVFNSLNSIREMILNNENKEASHFLSKFAQLMRLTLDHSSRSFISLRSTMDYLQRYMEMEQIRNEYFTCRILADEELDPDDVFLPPMLIQPFIENAIWHGVAGGKKDIDINIDFKKEGEQLVCIIDDNGIGINRSLQNKMSNELSHSSVGIANIKNRVQLLNEKYGLKCSVDIIDKSDGPGYNTGTRVTIRLPLQINDE